MTLQFPDRALTKEEFLQWFFLMAASVRDRVYTGDVIREATAAWELIQKTK